MFVIVAMYLFWVIKLQTYYMPIQHRVGEYSREFDVTLGAVREIVVDTSKEENAIELEITVYNETNEECWNKKYTDVIFDGKRRTIELFPRENPLVLDSGRYRAEIKINGEPAYASMMFVEYNGSFNKLYLGLCILLTLGVITLLIIKEYNKIPLEVAYIATMIIMGIIYNYIMPPLGVPDETSHLWKAYELSSKMMLQEPYDEEGYLMVREDVYESITYLHNTASISGWYASFGEGNADNVVTPGFRSTVSTKAPYAYFAPAVGITVARILGCNGHVLLLMGRGFNMIALILLIALAIRIIPYGKSFYYVLGSLPEVIYLFNSYSYDGLNLALCMLIVAYFLYLYNEAKEIGWKELGIFLLLLLLMIPIKVVYIAFGLLLLLLPLKKVTISKKQIAIVGIIGIMGAGIFLLINLPLVMTIIGTTNTTVNNGTEETLITLGYVLENKQRSLLIYLNTILGNTNDYFSCALGQIIGSERYSGLDYYVVPTWMQNVIVVLMILGLEDTKNNKLPIGKKAVGWGAVIFTYMAVLTSMFFAWTVIANTRIMGVQGRYFLPIFVLLPILIHNKYFKIEKGSKGTCVIGIGMVNLLFTFLMFFHYASNYFK